MLILPKLLKPMNISFEEKKEMIVEMSGIPAHS